MTGMPNPMEPPSTSMGGSGIMGTPGGGSPGGPGAKGLSLPGPGGSPNNDLVASIIQQHLSTPAKMGSNSPPMAINGGLK